ncbi:MAG TPA: hypothetical protein VGE12_09110 [Noviherbaspirillum sp.]
MEGTEKRDRAARERQSIDDKTQGKQEGLANQNVTGPASIPVQRRESTEQGSENPKPQGITQRPSP